MTSMRVGTLLRTIVAIILFGLGVLTGSMALGVDASPTSTSSCATDTRAQATQETTWSAPPQNTSGRPGQPY